MNHRNKHRNSPSLGVCANEWVDTWQSKWLTASCLSHSKWYPRTSHGTIVCSFLMLISLLVSPFLRLKINSVWFIRANTTPAHSFRHLWSEHPCLCQNRSPWSPAEKTGRGSLFNRPRVPRRPNRLKDWAEQTKLNYITCKQREVTQLGGRDVRVPCYARGDYYARKQHSLHCLKV